MASQRILHGQLCRVHLVWLRTSGRKGRFRSTGLTGLRMSFTPIAQPAVIEER